MGFFGKDKKEENKMKTEDVKKYVETISFFSAEELDAAIAERIRNRIIKDIQYQKTTGSAGPTYSAMILYDFWAEKARAEKEKGLGLER